MIPKPYVCLAQEAASELVIKKSRFLCRLIPAETEEQARQEIEKVRKEHYNARHNCFAMILGANRDFEKSSDDGEPQGTAGIPMLEVLRKSGLTNILAVVTRYFGGTLLGAGGLVRAYSGAVAQALEEGCTGRTAYPGGSPALPDRLCRLWKAAKHRFGISRGAHRRFRGKDTGARRFPAGRSRRGGKKTAGSVLGCGHL